MKGVRSDSRAPATREPASATKGTKKGARAETPRLKMKELCEQTGLPRQAVHFYIQQGLVPEGHKTGRNMAYYGQEHVDRIKLVRQLQHERFMPLRAIRALLEERNEIFSTVQRRTLAEVQETIARSRSTGATALLSDGATIKVADVLKKSPGVTKDDLRDFEEIGLLVVRKHRGGERIARDDAWMIELFSEMRAAGLTRDLGFSARDLSIYEDAIGKLFDAEINHLRDRLAALPPAQIAAVVERALPLINVFLARYHITRARHFFSTLKS